MKRVHNRSEPQVMEFQFTNSELLLNISEFFQVLFAQFRVFFGSFWMAHKEVCYKTWYDPKFIRDEKCHRA